MRVFSVEIACDNAGSILVIAKLIHAKQSGLHHGLDDLACKLDKLIRDHV